MKKEQEVAQANVAANQPEPAETTTAVAEKETTAAIGIGFRAYLSVEDALALKKFFEDRQIKFEAI